MIEILEPGALNTVQDIGRTGSRRYGVGTAGAMDCVALEAGNRMLGNAPSAAGIEVQVLPCRIRFLQDMAFALTGGDTGADLDGAAVPPWWAQQAHAGQVLTLGGAGSGFRCGARAYVLVAGGLDVPMVLGSRSTQLRGQFGGYEGRALARGDLLPCGKAESIALQGLGFGVVPAAIALPESLFVETPSQGVTAMRVLPAAEYDQFDADALQAFWDTDWKISAQSDRYGYRLAGVALTRRGASEIRSHGIVPGVIQVPHSGQPIIQMRDAQPSGGYPKIGTVIEADLWRLGQACAGSRICFVPCSYEQAAAAVQPIEHYLGQLSRLVNLYRQLHD
jgi:biotin-dependent carboxylase-like uncharacterized protein